MLYTAVYGGYSRVDIPPQVPEVVITSAVPPGWEIQNGTIPGSSFSFITASRMPTSSNVRFSERNA